MKSVLIFILISFSKLFAQDTLIFHNYSKKIVNIIEVTNYDVIYKNVKDKKERSFIMPFSEILSINYRDSTKMNVDSIYQVSNGLVYIKKGKRDTVSKDVAGAYRQMDTLMYNKGVEDARYYFTYDDFFLSNKRKVPLHNGINNIYRQNSAERQTDLDIDYPDKNLAKNKDYRAGYVDEMVKKRTIFGFCTAAGISILIFSIIFMVTSN